MRANISLFFLLLLVAKPVYGPGISKKRPFRPPRPIFHDSSKSLSHLLLWRAVASEVFAGQIVVLDKGSVQAYAANTLPVVILLERQDVGADSALDSLNLVGAGGDAGVEEADHVVA